MAEYSVVGKRVPRVDALSKVTGAAIYSGDVTAPNMLYGKILRSPLPHAAIRRLDVTKAQALDGVMAVITAADVPGYKNKSTLLLNELPRIASTKVVYAEQPVAVVAATSVKVAEKALELIEVEYEELPPILDVMEAMKPETPLIHPELYTNLIIDTSPGKDARPSNVAYHVHIKRGNLEAGFKAADTILENTYRTKAVHHGYLEPFSALATADVSGKVTIWTQSQGIFKAQKMISEFLDLPVSQVKLVQVEIGGAFGGKTYLPLAPLCALLAIKTGRPVRMDMTRDEVLKDSRPAPEAVITVKIGATKEGDITAASASLIYNAGAFPEMSHAMFASLNVFSQYKIPNLEIEAKDVLTTQVPVAFYRSPGTTQSHFAVESQIDVVAKTLGIDPLKLRIRNAAQAGDTAPNGAVLPRVGFKKTLEAMVRHLQQKAKPEGKGRGRGVACGFWHGGTGSFGAYVNVNGDGSVNLVLGVTDISGSRTSIAQIVAEELCLPMDKVVLTAGDTDTAPWATMSVGSLTVYSLSTAAYRACQDVKAQLGSLAAGKLDVDAAEIEFSQGVFQIKGDPQKAISFEELASSTLAFGGEGPVIGRGSIGGLPPAPTLSAHAVDVEVDEETGKVKVLSYVAAQDVGLAINPLSVEGQIQGAVTQGIGWALMENYIFEKGAVQNTTLLDYRLPTATDVPIIDTLLVEVGSNDGVYGLRHAGEPPIIPVPAAIANAIHSATGVRMNELPMTPEAVFNAIHARK
ncbi:xanthine dehydrogenase family protein molybdopterin-binding subunit [Chloroflexota bacterium]